MDLGWDLVVKPRHLSLEGYSGDTVGYSEDTVRVQWGYSEDTVKVQWGYSEGTVREQCTPLSSPQGKGKYLDRRRETGEEEGESRDNWPL